MAATIVLLDSRRRPRRDASDACRLYPRGNYGFETRRWLYAIGYTDGRTKIGIARRPRERMFTHWVACGGSIEWTHLFRSFLAPRSGRDPAVLIERAALRNAGQIGERIRRTECFRNLSRTEAIRCVRQAIEEQGG